MSRKAKKILSDFWEVVKNTAIRWDAADPWRQSAILAYYSIFSLPALLLIVIVIAGYFLGEESVSEELYIQVAELLGSDVARMVTTMVANVAEMESSWAAFMFGLGFLLFGATTVFYHLQLSLNRIWGVVPRPKKAFLKYLKDRLFSFGLVLSIGFLILLSLLLNSLLSILGDWLISHWPDIMAPFMAASNYVISLVVISTLFALMFKILPDAVIRWRSVWIGALLTALLFALGQFGLSVYFRMT